MNRDSTNKKDRETRSCLLVGVTGARLNRAPKMSAATCAFCSSYVPVKKSLWPR